MVNSKNGGTGIKGGKLFVTASPCELCSKKSYQLGITDIYYIDPYPGIAQEHIINFGAGKDFDAEDNQQNNANNPKVHLYYGAIGDAYIRLYTQTISKKDELESLTGKNVKQEVTKRDHPQNEYQSYDDLEIEKITIEFEFQSRTIIECRRTIVFRPQKPNIKSIDRILSWTGNNYNGTSVSPEPYEIKETINNDTSYHHYTINFNQDLETNKTYQLTLVSKVKDEHMVMSPYFSNRIKYVTKELCMAIIAPRNVIAPKTMRFVTFADLYMKQKIKEKNVKAEERDGKIIYYTKQINPILNYSYSMMWKF